MPGPLPLNPHTIDRSRWYGLALWRRRSTAQLKAQPLCEECRRHDRVSVADQADHIEPWTDWNSFRCGKLQSLCLACHVRKHHPHAVLTGSDLIGEDGWPIGEVATTPAQMVKPTPTPPESLPPAPKRWEPVA